MSAKRLRAAREAYDAKDYRKAIACYQKAFSTLDDPKGDTDLPLGRHFLCFGKALLEYGREFRRASDEYLLQQEEYLDAIATSTTGTLAPQPQLEEAPTSDKYYDMAEQALSAAERIAENAITEALNARDLQRSRLNSSLGTGAASDKLRVRYKRVDEACKRALYEPCDLGFSAKFALITCTLERGLPATRQLQALFRFAAEHGFAPTELREGIFALYTFFSVVSDHYEDKKLRASMKTMHALQATGKLALTTVADSHASESESEEEDLPPEDALIDLLKDLHHYYVTRLSDSKLLTKRNVLGWLTQSKAGQAQEEDAIENLRLLERKLYSMDCGFKNYVVERQFANPGIVVPGTEKTMTTTKPTSQCDTPTTVSLTSLRECGVSPDVLYRLEKNNLQHPGLHVNVGGHEDNVLDKSSESSEVTDDDNTFTPTSSSTSTEMSTTSSDSSLSTETSYSSTTTTSLTSSTTSTSSTTFSSSYSSSTSSTSSSDYKR